MATANKNPWFAHLAKYKEDNPTVSHKDAMVEAKLTYVSAADKAAAEEAEGEDGEETPEETPETTEAPAEESKGKKGGLKGKKLRDKATKLGITFEEDDKDSLIDKRVKCIEAGLSYDPFDNEDKLTERLKLFKEDQKKRDLKQKAGAAADKEKEKKAEEAENKYGVGTIAEMVDELIKHPDLREKPSILGQLRQAAHKLKTAKELMRGA